MNVAAKSTAKASTAPRRAAEGRSGAEKQMGKLLLGVIAVSLAFLIGLFVYAAFTL